MWGPLIPLSAHLGPSVPFLDLFAVFYVSNALVSSALPDSIEVGVYSWHPGRRNRHLVHCLFCRLTFWRLVSIVGIQEVEIDTLSTVSPFLGSLPYPVSLPAPCAILGSNDFEC